MEDSRGPTGRLKKRWPDAVARDLKGEEFSVTEMRKVVQD